MLGPVMFLLLNNELLNYRDTLLADDMSLVVSAQDPEKLLEVRRSFIVSFVGLLLWISIRYKLFTSDLEIV